MGSQVNDGGAMRGRLVLAMVLLFAAGANAATVPTVVSLPHFLNASTATQVKIDAVSAASTASRTFANMSTGLRTGSTAATVKSTPISADFFSFWDSVTGGLRKLTWSNIISTLGGIFQPIGTYLTGLTASGPITVGGTATAPTLKLGSVPFGNSSTAMRGRYDPAGSAAAITTITGNAGNVTGIVATANGGTGVANNAASTLTISGNYATTLTVSGTTGVTLPTSGTLAKNDGSNLTISGQAVGDIPVASSTTAYGKLADVAVGQVLTSGGTGTAPSYSATPTVNNMSNLTVTNTALASTTINLDGVSYADYNYSNGTTAASYTTGWTSRPAAGSVRYITLTLNPSKASGVITMTWTGVTWIGTAGASATTASKASMYVCTVGNSTSYCKIVQEAY